MSEIVSLTDRRWDANSDTRAHSVTDMLRVMIAKIERGEIEADHAIVCVGHVNDERNSVCADWMQAGAFNFFTQLGLLERTKLSLMSSAEDSHD